MKTLKNKQTGKIKRVNDKEAHSIVSSAYLGWEYCSKSEWKSNRQSVVEEKSETTSQNVESNISDKKIRKQRKEQKRQKHESRK